MSRYVLVEFEDDKVAENFCKKIEGANKTSPYAVVGVFAKPTKFCQCPHPSGYHANQVVMGSKYGWWVCVTCKRARLGSHFSKNLISIYKTEPSDEEYTTVPQALQLIEASMTFKLVPSSLSVSQFLSARLTTAKLVLPPDNHE